MASNENAFSGFDFDRAWDERDWERFFEVQDRWALSGPADSALERPGVDPGLSFRRVLRQFGMDPDHPGAEPRVFSSLQGAGDPSTGRFPFWRPGADHERLPVYLRARRFATQIAELVDGRFAVVMCKTYKSRSHRAFQRHLAALDDNARWIPRLLALGHRVGYDPDGAVGNMVRCRQALERAETCVTLLSRLPGRHMDRTLYRGIFGASVRLRNAVLEWVLMIQDRFALRPGRRA